MITINPQGLAAVLSAPAHTFSQCFPPQAGLTEKDYPDLTGKVCLVTGSNSGIGKEVARLLYSKNASVYMAARTESKGLEAIAWIKSEHPDSSGKIEFLQLDLGDLSKIKAVVDSFLAVERELHLLINNAAVLDIPRSQKTPQGHEMEMGTNCIGPQLLTRLLTPTLVATAQVAPENTVRVLWVSSFAVDVAAPRGGVNMDQLKAGQGPAMAFSRYAISKAGNYFQAVEYAKEHKKDGITSLAVHPGDIRTDITRNSSAFFRLATHLVTYPAIQGAYTELWAALSPEATLERTGEYVGPWGRFVPIVRGDIIKATKWESEGGDGVSKEFWDWCDGQVEAFL